MLAGRRCLLVCILVGLRRFRFTVCLLPFFLFFLCVFMSGVSLSVCVSVCRFVGVCFFVLLSFFRSVCLYVCLSVCLAVFMIALHLYVWFIPDANMARLRSLPKAGLPPEHGNLLQRMSRGRRARASLRIAGRPGRCLFW